MGLFLGVLRKTICLWPTFGFLYQCLKRKKQNILSDCLNFLCCCKIYFLTKWPFYHNFVVFERNADSYFPCIVVVQWNSIFIFNPGLPTSTLLWGLGLQDWLIFLISRKQLILPDCVNQCSQFQNPKHPYCTVLELHEQILFVYCWNMQRDCLSVQGYFYAKRLAYFERFFMYYNNQSIW